MNSRQLQYAITLSQVLNFSQAAETLGISQPSLSKQILGLEAELGVKLFDRDHSPLRLTAAGSYFIPRAKQMLYDEAQLYKAMTQFESGESGKLVIGVTPFRSLYLMPELVKKVKARFPGVQVVLHETGSAQLTKEATEGNFDFAIINLPQDESVLEVTPLEPDTLVLAVPEVMAEKVKTEAGHISFAQAKDLPFVVLGKNQELRQLFDKLCAAADVEPKIAAEVVGVTTAWAMARAGVGAALLPLQFVRSAHVDEDLVLFTLEDNTYSRQPAIVTRRGQYISEYARYAMDLLTDNI